MVQHIQEIQLWYAFYYYNSSNIINPLNISLKSSDNIWHLYISSGTYNNQYMIIDLKEIELKQTIKDNALWVVEQIPGYVAGGDQTAILRAGITQHWSTVTNIPLFL